MICSTCKKKLDTLNPLSANCGGDCYACIIEAEDLLERLDTLIMDEDDVLLPSNKEMLIQTAKIIRDQLIFYYAN